MTASRSAVPRPDAHVHFGVFFQGVNHTTIWSDSASGSQIDFETFRRLVLTAERGLFDAFFLGEGPAASGTERQDSRSGYRRPTRRHCAVGRPRRYHRQDRVGRDTEHHVQRTGRPCASTLRPRPTFRRTGRLECGDHRQRVDGRELPSRWFPRPLPALRACRAVHRNCAGTVGFVGRRRDLGFSHVPRTGLLRVPSATCAGRLHSSTSP